MSIIALGRAQVRKYERALGGEPPRTTLRKTQSEMSRYLAARSRASNAARKEIASLSARRRDLLFRQMAEAEPDLQTSNAKLKRMFEQRAKRKIAKPPLRKIEPRVIAGSNFAFHAPPYDGAWTYHPGSNAADADPSDGTYDLACQSFGDGNQEAAAGVASWFFCTDADPQQRFAALIDYSDDWWDSAMGYVAHNDLRTRLWVFGQTENDWVWKSDVQPGWSDGVSWFDNHGNDPNGDQGRLSVETLFPAQANSWYLAWVWSDGQAYGDGGFFGFGASSIHFSASVPLMVFGSLF